VHNSNPIVSMPRSPPVLERNFKDPVILSHGTDGYRWTISSFTCSENTNIPLNQFICSVQPKDAESICLKYRECTGYIEISNNNDPNAQPSVILLNEAPNFETTGGTIDHLKRVYYERIP